MCKWLVDASRLRELHTKALEDYPGSYGERDPGYIESCSSLALQAAIYHTEETCEEPDQLVYVSHLIRSLVQNHPFVDGNKRVGWYAVVYSLGLEQVTIDATNEEAAQFVIDIAEKKMTPNDICTWIAPRLRPRS
jgi:death on curing protein